jgi:hypothetical protein
MDNTMEHVAGQAGGVFMLSYQIDLLNTDGSRNCLLAILCMQDMAAIAIARAILRVQRIQGTRILVWREDTMIFEDARAWKVN